MSTEFRHHSPQLTKTIEIEDHKKETTYRSLQVSKSINVLSEQHDEQTIMIKKKITNQQLSIFNEDLINRKYQQNSPEQEQNNLQTSLNTLRNNEEQQMQSLSNKVCYFCYMSLFTCSSKLCNKLHLNWQLILDLCLLSNNREINYNEKNILLIMQITIEFKHSKQSYHLKGCIYFNFQKWKEFKFSLFLEFLLITMVVITVIYSAIILLEQFNTNSNYISTYTKIILICTFGFIVCVVVISKILQHFKAIKFEVQQYYPRNIDYNIQYLKLLVQD